MKGKYKVIAEITYCIWLFVAFELHAQSSASFKIRGSSFVSAGEKSTSASFALQSAMGQGGVLGISSSAGFALGGGFLRTLSASLPEVALVAGNPPAGINARVRAAITDPYGMPLTGTLYYRQAGLIPFSSPVPMTAVGDTFTGIIPAVQVGLRGLEIYISASNGVDEGTFPLNEIPQNQPHPLRVSINASAPATADRVYRLISFPFETSPPTALAQIADNFSLTDPKVARLFWWMPKNPSRDAAKNGYTEYGDPGFPPFILGRSMFLATNGSQTYNGVGLSTLPDTTINGLDYVRFPLDSGVNMVATPFDYPVDYDSVSVLAPDGSIHPCSLPDTGCTNWLGTTGVRQYIGGTSYSIKRVMLPWTGYFAFNLRTEPVIILFPKLQMNIPITTPRPATQHEINWPVDWKIAVTAKSGDLVVPATVLGAAKNASRGYDQLDLPLPPALPGDFRVAFRAQKESGLSDDYLSDIRPTLTESETWGFTVEPGETRAIELNFDGLAEVPADYDVILSDKEGRAKQNLRLEPVYRFIATEDRHFELTVTPKTSAQAALLPTKYELYQNLPNPFNPQTLIKYDLPQAAFVRLEVFNILGQKVTTLVGRYEAAGPKSVLWNGSDASGNKVASGIYFYKLSAGEYAATKKMTFLK